MLPNLALLKAVPSVLSDTFHLMQAGAIFLVICQHPGLGNIAVYPWDRSTITMPGLSLSVGNDGKTQHVRVTSPFNEFCLKGISHAHVPFPAWSLRDAWRIYYWISARSLMFSFCGFTCSPDVEENDWSGPSMASLCCIFIYCILCTQRRQPRDGFVT